MNNDKNKSPAPCCENCKHACGHEKLYCMEQNKSVEKHEFCLMHEERLNGI